MKYCMKCGTSLPDEAMFCEKCGARQQAEPSAKQQSADQSSSRMSSAQSEPKKKSLGEKMMDNFRTNRALQKQRLKNFKWWYWVIIAVALAYFMGA